MNRDTTKHMHSFTLTGRRRLARATIALAWTSVFVLLLAACGEDSAGVADDEPTAAAEQTESSDAVAEGGVECDEPVDLLYGSSVPEGGPLYLGGVEFGDYLEEHAPGCFNFRISSGGELGGVLDILQAVEAGAVQMAFGAFDIQTYAPEAALTATPFLFRDREHAETVVEGPVGEQIIEVIESKSPFKVLGFWTAGDRHILSNIAVREDADLQNLNLRVPGSPIMLAVWEATGANPIDLPHTDIYTALETGTIDAIEFDAVNLYDQGFHEVAQFYTLTDHLTGMYPALLGKDFFESLDPELQQVVLDAGKEASRAQRQIDVEAIDEAMANLEEAGIEIIEFDSSGLREDAQGVYDEFPEQLPPDLVEAIINS